MHTVVYCNNFMLCPFVYFNSIFIMSAASYILTVSSGSPVCEGRDSSVGIATGYGMDGPGIESRWRARFYAPVQTGPGAHPASYRMGTKTFPGVRRPGRGVDHPQPSSAEVKERVEPYLSSPSGPSWPVLR